MIKICQFCKKEFKTYKHYQILCSLDCRYKNQVNTPADFWQNVKILSDTECWEWQGSMGATGYGQMHYNKEVWKCHRLAYFLKYGAIPDGMGILHSCDNPPCCNWHHLRPGTNRDNADDRVRAGHVTSGETNAMARYTTSQILEIRSLSAEGIFTSKELAFLFDTSQRYINQIVNRERWKHI